jgi:hypothetical protein
MRPSIVVALLLVAAPSLFAGTSIVVDTTTSDLPPGSRVRIEAGAEYRLLEFEGVKPEERGRPTITRSASDMNIKYRLPAQQPIVWEFTVPGDGDVAPRQFTLNFPKTLAPPPKGMAGTVAFPIKYTIHIPAMNGKPAWQRTNTSTATMRIPADGRWNRCLRVENWGESGFFVGMTPDCVHDIRNDKRGSVSRSR